MANPFLTDDPVEPTTSTTSTTIAEQTATVTQQDDDLGEYDPGGENAPSRGGKVTKLPRTPTIGGYSWSSLGESTLGESDRGTSSSQADKQWQYDQAAWERLLLRSGPYLQGAPVPTGIQPKYSTLYPVQRMNEMSSAELSALALNLQESGYLAEDAFTGGMRTVDLLEGFGKLVLDSDFSRNRWEDQLDWAKEEFAANEAESAKERRDAWEKANPFIMPDRKIPDYATLAQQVKASVRGTLERDATDSEMKLLTQYLQGQHKDAWQANEVQVARSSWEKNARAVETEEAQGANTINLVDPNARFGEYFEDRFEGELEHRERVSDVQEKQGNLFASLDNISRMV